MENLKIHSYGPEISKSRQSVHFVELIEFLWTDEEGTHKAKLRIAIKSDSYDFQSFARIAKWDGNQWQPMANIPYSNMKTPHGMYVWGEVEPRWTNPRNFEGDREALIKKAKEILG